MARQEGLMRYTGVLGGVRHYRLKGSDKWYASMKSGPTREQVLTSSSFERSRENMSEFGGVAKAVGSFRMCINSLKRRFTDSGMNGRLMRKMYGLLRRDKVGKRGERSVSFSKYGRELVGFEWNGRRSLRSALGTGWSVEWKDVSTAKVTIKRSVAEGLMNAPKGATHCRVVVVVSAVSDFEYDVLSKHHVMNVVSNGERSEVWSDYVDVKSGVVDDMVLECGLGGADVGSCGVFVSLGVEFYEACGDWMYVMREAGSMVVAGWNADGAFDYVRGVYVVAGDEADTGIDERFMGRLRFKRIEV